jgi:hypothetical protein
VALVDRVRNILTQPAAEWPVIAGEPATIGSLYTGYIIPLAAIPAVAAFIGRLVFAHNIVISLVLGVMTYILSLIVVFVLGFIAAALAPSFGGVNDQVQGLKWAAYSSTAAWVAGIFNVIPILGPLIALLGSLYSLYLLYLGTVPVMRVPQEKAIGYAVVVILCYIVLTVIIGAVVGIVIAALAIGSAATSGALHS